MLTTLIFLKKLTDFYKKYFEFKKLTEMVRILGSDSDSNIDKVFHLIPEINININWRTCRKIYAHRTP